MWVYLLIYHALAHIRHHLCSAFYCKLVIQGRKTLWLKARIVALLAFDGCVKNRGGRLKVGVYQFEILVLIVCDMCCLVCNLEYRSNVTLPMIHDIIMVSVLDCQSSGFGFKSWSGQKFYSKFLLHLANSSMMSMQTIHCQWVDETVRERTGHPPSYTEGGWPVQCNR